MSTEILVY